MYKGKMLYTTHPKDYKTNSNNTVQEIRDKKIDELLDEE